MVGVSPRRPRLIASFVFESLAQRKGFLRGLLFPSPGTVPFRVDTAGGKEAEGA